MTKTLRKPPKGSTKLKISISISPTMLARTDAHAEELEVTRSAVIQSALREFLAK